MTEEEKAQQRPGRAPSSWRASPVRCGSCSLGPHRNPRERSEIPSHAGEGLHQVPDGAAGRLPQEGAALPLGRPTKPNKRLQQALAEETESEWQPQVGAQARQRAASSGGLVISCRAYFGIGPEGTSDAGRVRDITVAVSPTHAVVIITAQEEGATEDDLHDAVAEAIVDAYFRQGGGVRAGLEVKFADV